MVCLFPSALKKATDGTIAQIDRLKSALKIGRQMHMSDGTLPPITHESRLVSIARWMKEHPCYCEFALSCKEKQAFYGPAKFCPKTFSGAWKGSNNEPESEEIRGMWLSKNVRPEEWWYGQ